MVVGKVSISINYGLPFFDARIRFQATLVGGECLHHCATLARPVAFLLLTINIFPLFS